MPFATPTTQMAKGHIPCSPAKATKFAMPSTTLSSTFPTPCSLDWRNICPSACKINLSATTHHSNPCPRALILYANSFWMSKRCICCHAPPGPDSQRKDLVPRRCKLASGKAPRATAWPDQSGQAMPPAAWWSRCHVCNYSTTNRRGSIPIHDGKGISGHRVHRADRLQPA